MPGGLCSIETRVLSTRSLVCISINSYFPITVAESATPLEVVPFALPDIQIHTIPYSGLKRFYSVMLFFSFVAGAMQPFLPSLEYFFFKEHIIVHHCVNKENLDVECGGLCYLNRRIDETSHWHEDMALSSHVKYYPGAILSSS